MGRLCELLLCVFAVMVDYDLVELIDSPHQLLIRVEAFKAVVAGSIVDIK